MPSLAHYTAQYDHEHETTLNKLLHVIGIPVIFTGILLLLFLKWIWGAGFFLGGWVLLFLGHRMEGNRPAFLQGSLGVSHGNTPQADLRGYPAKLRLELSTAGSTSAKPRTLRNEGGLYERRKRQFCR